MKYLLLVLIMVSLASSPFAQDDGIDDQKAVKILSSVLPSEAAARQHLANLRKLSADTPYQPLVVVGVAHKLLVWGWKEDNSIKLIKACANAAAATGAGDEQFAQIVLLVGRLTDSEQSTYAAISGLEDTDIPAWQLVAYLIGKNSEQTKALSLKRQLDPKILAQALIAGFNEKYAGAAEREAKKVKMQKQ